MTKVLCKSYNLKFYNLIINKVINKVLKKGKRSQSDKVFNNSILELKLKKNLKGRKVILFYEKALRNIFVRFNIKSRKRGKLTQLIPVPLKKIENVYSNTLHLLITNLRKRRGNPIHANFVGELLDISQNQGVVKKKVIEINKMVIKNRKFMK